MTVLMFIVGLFCGAALAVLILCVCAMASDDEPDTHLFDNVVPFRRKRGR